jgi:hypothetical protein
MRPHLQSVLALVAIQYLVCIYAHCLRSARFPSTLNLSHTVAERVHGNQHMANICLCLCQSLFLLLPCIGAWESTHVDFAILEPLLQVVVDGLIGDFTDQCEI